MASLARKFSPFAQTQDQRRAFACADHALRLVAAEHGDGVGALQPLRGALHGVEQVAVVQVVHQVGDDLGVGLAGEFIAALLQFGAQLVVVFDDAVVHQRNAVAAEVRVRVVYFGCAVRGPARVGDAGAGSNAILGHAGFQLGHAGSAARALELAALVHRHATAVVAAVFQALQAFDQDGDDVAVADRADDAAHG